LIKYGNKKNEYIVIDSHIDTVINGDFDGTVGVLSGIEVLKNSMRKI